jgi:hypothetical protein
MEAPATRAHRLLTALELLLTQEGRYRQAGLDELMLATRQRAEPLVQQLAMLAGACGVTGLDERVRAILERNDEHARCLQVKMAELGAEIQRLEGARQRVAQLLPAYAGVNARLWPRFEAAG